jgi:Protein of unknown function (DUF1573)
MRYTQRLLVFILALTGLAAARAPQAVLSAAAHDFGTVKQGEMLSHVLTLRNGGDNPLRIQGVDLTLPGLRAVFPKEVPPGGEAKIRIEWNTAYVNGVMEGEAHIRTNDPGHARISFAFRAVVTPPIEILPLSAAFFSVFEGETSEQTLRIINHEDVPLAIERLDVQGHHFVARVETITPGRVFQLHLNIPAGVAPGRYMEAVSLQTDQSQPIRVPVNVLVKRELHVDPEVIDFGTIPLQRLDRTPGVLDLLTQVVTVRRRQGEFEIRSIESDLRGLEITKTPAASSNVFQVEIRLVRNRLQQGPLEGTVLLHTNDAKSAPLVIRVRGEVQ